MILKSPLGEFDLPEIYQYEDYRYAPECCCPECSRLYEYGGWLEHNTEGIKGFCVHNDGSILICLECPECGTRYRYHYCEKWTNGKFNVEYWKHQVGLAIGLMNEKTGEYEDLKVK